MRARNVQYLVLFAIIMSVMIYGNTLTIKGSIMEDALPDYDAVFQSNAEAKKVFGGTEGNRIILTINGELNVDHINAARVYQETLDSYLPAMTVVSLDNVRGYKDQDETLHPINFFDISDPLFHKNGQFDIKKWKRLLRTEPALMPAFVGNSFEYFAFMVYPSQWQEMDEIDVFQAVTEALERQEISALEWMFKTDIYPKNPDVLAAGWTMLLGLIDGALNAEILMKIVGIGMPISFLAFFAFTRSIFQAALATVLVVGCSIVWVRGEIGLAYAFGFGLKERVYILLAYTNCIVQGISFSLHLFDSYNQQTENDPWLRWKLAKKDVIGALRITTIIAIGGFATLYSFEVGTIRELGIISAMGVVNLFVLTTVFLPVFHMVFATQESKKAKSSKWLDKLFNRLDKFYEVVVELSLAVAQKISARLAGVILSVLVLLAIVPAYYGYLPVGTKSIDYLHGTLIEKTAYYMNAVNRPGFDVMEVFVQPKDNNLDDPWINNPEFTRSVFAFVKRLKEHVDVREVFSILDMVAKISQNTLHKPFPTTKGELDSIFMIMENTVISEVLEHFYLWNGFRLSVSIPAIYSPDMMVIQKYITKTALEYPNLEVLLFGNLAEYTSMDEYIIKGKPLNVLTSQVLVIVLCAIWAFRLISKSSMERHVWVACKVGIAMSSPFIFSSALIIITMMIFRVNLDVSTSAIGALAINASIDFSIYWTAWYLGVRMKGMGHDEALVITMRKEGKVVLGDAILNKVVFLTLISSRFVPVAQLGWMMVVMLFFAAVGALMIMPPLLRWAVK